MNKAVFLDRDGTINIDKGYVYKIEDFEFIEGVPEAIKMLNSSNYKVIVVTNQSGVARGYYTEKDVNILHEHINFSLHQYGAHIDAFYYCPHHAIFGIGQYKKQCSCRKPKAGMIEKAIEDLNIDVHKSWMIGDKDTDILAGIYAKISNNLLICESTENGTSNVYSNLLQAVKDILKNTD